MKISIIHHEWKDIVWLDFKTKRLYRDSKIEEKGDFIHYQNRLYITWDYWGKEVFICHEHIYYVCQSIFFHHTKWNDTCYLNSFYSLIYRESTQEYGEYHYTSNEELKVEWKYEIILPKIPNIIHFVYGFKENMEEFELYRYICIKSAYEINKPDKIYFYHYHEPYGYWWDQIKSLLTLEKIEPPTEIYGNKVYHYAHQADIIRLQKLIEKGGIYLDMDTICVQSFTNLLHHSFVMGAQINSDNTEIYGLCNAVLLSEPRSVFATKWYETYQSFRSKGRDEYWDEHSVIKPLQLSKEYSKYIHVMHSSSFFYPLWYNIQDILFHESIQIENYKYIIKHCYCIHLWDTYHHNYLKTLDTTKIFSCNTIYNILCRKFIQNKMSILLLTYNRYEITRKCLDSYVQCLDREDIQELIILDNNSEHHVIEYLKEFQHKHSKIKIILLHENRGVCGGRQILFKEANGDILISLDSDAFLINPSFFDRIKHLLYDEKYGIIGISGSYIKSWEFGSQEDIPDEDEKEYIVDHVSGCCQAFRKDLFHYGFSLDPFYEKFEY